MDWMLAGLLLIMLGILFIAIGIFSPLGSETHAEGALVLFVGPLPIVIANSGRAALAGLFVAVLVVLVVILWLKQ